MIVVTLLFVALQYIGSRLTYDTHWIFKRAEVARNLIRERNISHPVGSEEYFALGANTVDLQDWNFSDENK